MKYFINKEFSIAVLDFIVNLESILLNFINFNIKVIFVKEVI